MEEKKIKSSGKTIFLSCIMMILLTIALIMVFKGQWKDILSLLSTIPFYSMTIIILLGILYHILEASVGKTLVASAVPQFSFSQSITNTYLGVFGNTALFTVGTLPLQSYYLYRCGVMTGMSIGMMTLEYVTHKLSVLLYAVAAVLFGGHTLISQKDTYLFFVIYACVFAVIVSSFLILLCASSKIRELIFRLISYLPNNEKWNQRKEVWKIQIEMLYTQSNQVIHDRNCRVKSFLLNICKLFVFYSIPFWCFQALEIYDISFWQVQMLTAFMVLLTNALPNLAGMGSAEFSFLLVFSPFIGKAQAITALILYRISTYYVPFLISSTVFVYQQHKWRKNL
ncbi:MAG: lysylphosphatidylglycerol synthase transmembrane domain-containing protein [Massiliimalia sp.]|jgi:uncharacterized membrane protein YbhN (UPF0104 family)